MVNVTYDYVDSEGEIVFSVRFNGNLKQVRYYSKLWQDFMTEYNIKERDDGKK